MTQRRLAFARRPRPSPRRRGRLTDRARPSRSPGRAPSPARGEALRRDRPVAGRAASSGSPGNALSYAGHDRLTSGASQACCAGSRLSRGTTRCAGPRALAPVRQGARRAPGDARAGARRSGRSRARRRRAGRRSAPPQSRAAAVQRRKTVRPWPCVGRRGEREQGGFQRPDGLRARGPAHVRDRASPVNAEDVDLASSPTPALRPSVARCHQHANPTRGTSLSSLDATSSNVGGFPPSVGTSATRTKSTPSRRRSARPPIPSAAGDAGPTRRVPPAAGRRAPSASPAGRTGLAARRWPRRWPRPPRTVCRPEPEASRAGQRAGHVFANSLEPVRLSTTTTAGNGRATARLISLERLAHARPRPGRSWPSRLAHADDIADVGRGLVGTRHHFGGRRQRGGNAIERGHIAPRARVAASVRLTPSA